MPLHTSANRSARSYSFATQGTATSVGSGAGSAGKYVLKRLPMLDLWQPSWGEETIVRPYPMTVPGDSNQFDPYRFSTSYCDFGDWIRVYDAVRNFGSPGVTMLLHSGQNPSYDAQLMNPCWILYRAINQALTQGQGLADWVPLTKGGAGKSAVLSKPTKLYLMQCAIFRHKSKDTFGPNQPPLGANQDGGPTIVMALPATAGEGLLRLLEEKNEGWNGDPNSYEQYKYGDPVGIDEGRFVHIYELGKDPRTRYNASRQSNPASIYASSGNSGGAKGFGGLEPKGYGVFVTNTLDGGPNDLPATLTGMDQMVKQKVKQWDTILNFLSDEEQAHLIAPLFPASAILYAWRDRKSWIPDSVKESSGYEVKQPVSQNFGGQPSWNRQPQVAARPVTWGKPTTQVEAEQDTVVPEGDLENFDPISNAGADSMLAEDEAAKLAVAKAKLENAQAKIASARKGK